MGINPLDIIIHIINIAVLFVILRALLYKPVYKFMQARTERIQAALTEAEESKQAAESLKQQYNTALQAAEQDAAETAAKIIQKANTDADDIVSAAQNEAAQIVSDAGKKAEATCKKALADAKDDMKELSVAMAKKILAREVNEADNHNIIDTFFALADKGGVK